LWQIAKGKTKHSALKSGFHPRIIIKHAESGWATENSIVDYLQWIHAEMAGGQLCPLNWMSVQHIGQTL
jgi:hypothetical protein